MVTMELLWLHHHWRQLLLRIQQCRYVFNSYFITAMILFKQLLHHCDHVILVLARTVYSWNIVLPLATSLSRVLGKGKRSEDQRPLLNMPPWKKARKVITTFHLFVIDVIYVFTDVIYVFTRIQVHGEIL